MVVCINLGGPFCECYHTKGPAILGLSSGPRFLETTPGTFLTGLPRDRKTQFQFCDISGSRQLQIFLELTNTCK